MDLRNLWQNRKNPQVSPRLTRYLCLRNRKWLGGLSRVRELVDRFYAHMGGDEAFAATRSFYPEQLKESKEKLFEFLVGWLGGARRRAPG